MDKIIKIRTKINTIRHEMEIGANLNKNFINMIMQTKSTSKHQFTNNIYSKNNNS